MLITPRQNGSTKFQMSLKTVRDVTITFTSIRSFLQKTAGQKKIIFVDPVVLANQDILLEIEESDPRLLLVPTNLYEANKDIASTVAILEVLEANGIGRRGDLVIAVGGGALLDTVAFAASIFRRGISVIKVPTTLLGIVDAAIGIKTGINFHGQRNRIGSYFFDYTVVIDPTLMKGLHRGLVRQGLGEIFKIAVIKSQILFDFLNLHISNLNDIEFYQTPEGLYLLRTSIQLMLEELHDNPREDNLMRCVDYGHSFSPLIEMESIKREGCKAVPHGYSVAYDCLLTATISLNRAHLTEIEFNKILSLYTSFDFGFDNEIYLDYNLMWSSFLEMTKHRGGDQNLPIPIAIGSYSFLQDVTFTEMKTCARILRDFLIK